MASRFVRSSTRALWLALRVYLLVLVALFFLQRKLIYLPNREPEATMLAQASGLGVAPWREASGAIIGWKSAARPDAAPPANRLVVFHGNAGHALMRTHFIAGFEALDGGKTWEVFLFEYPGFGARPGQLGEQPFTAAGQAALAQLAAADDRPIFLLGESLGSGPACALAALEPRVAGILLITPYASLAALAQKLYPIVPVRLLLRDRWENVAALPKFRGRVAVMLAGEDEIIPVAQGRQLFDAANEPKRLWIEAGATHNGLTFNDDAPWWREVSESLLRP